MAVPPIPPGHNTVSPYLIVSDPAGLIEFLQKTFNATELFRMRLQDGRVMHAEVRIGDSVVMMGQASDQHPAMPAVVHVYVADVDAAHARGLQAGASSIMAPTDQFYGDRSGGLRDAYGNQWWIATHREDVPDDELARRAEAFSRSRG